MRGLISNKKGLTLVEVVVSVALIGILSIPISLLLSMNIRLNMESRNQIIATNLAEYKIEELKFKNHIKTGEEIKNKDGFTIKAITEIVDRKDIDKEDDDDETIIFNDLYKLIVEVKRDDKVIEKLITYRSSLELKD